MKKHIRIAAMVLTAVILGSIGAVHAEIIPPDGDGQIGWTSVVLCESLTVRAEPRTDAAAVQTLPYGKRVMVQNKTDQWVQCFTSDALDSGPVGWINTDFIVIDPAWFHTKADTPVYAWNDTTAPKVALIGRDVTLPILKQDGGWLVVSLRGAAGWIWIGEAE